MSISEIKELKVATNYAVESQDMTSTKKEIINLFENKKFFNGGNSSKTTLETEVNTLQNYISEKNNEYEQKYTELCSANKELRDLNKKLEDEILEITLQADKEEREQRVQIQNAINEVNQMYMNGDIEKNDMSSELNKKISKYSTLSSNVSSKVSRLNNTKLRIEAITTKIATIIDSANKIEAELNLAKGTMSIFQNLTNKMSIKGSEDKTTKAIGYSNNGKTYNFIIDKNNDNKLNNNSELLGAANGFDELKALDTNGDNQIDYQEMNAKNMFVMMTDNTTGTSKFMSLLESGIKSIDLSTITSEDFSEMEEPQIKNIFMINTIDGVSIQGNEEINTKNFDETDILVSVDEAVLNDTKNVFSKQASLSSDGLKDNVTNAVLSIKSAQSEIKKTTNEMRTNNIIAKTKLTQQKRPETKEEKEAREKEEKENKEKEEVKLQEEAKVKEEKEKAELKEKEEAKAKEKEEKENKEKAEKSKNN